MGRILMPPWWWGHAYPGGRADAYDRAGGRPTEERISYSDGYEYKRRDRRGRLVEHVVCREARPYVNERYAYRRIDGRARRIVTHRDGVPVEQEGADNG